MAVNYSAALKNTRMAAVLAAIDQDVGPGSLEIGSAGFAAILVTIPVDDPAGSVTADVLTIGGLPNTAVIAITGTAAEARIKDNSGDIIVSGLTVGTSGTNIIVSTVSFVAGVTASLNSGTITHSA